MFGICNLNICALRVEPNENAIMTTQILFGETFEILEKNEFWSKIKLSYDEFEAFIKTKQYIEITAEQFQSYTKKQVFTNELVAISNSEERNIHLLAGSHLPNFNGDTFTIRDTTFNYKGATTTTKLDKSELIKIASNFLNSPFLHGGKSIFGMDSANLIHLTYQLWGHKVSRVIEKQAQQGEMLSFIMESEAGDLAFFDDEDSSIFHVGIVMDNDSIIHSDGKVRIDKLDQFGIYNVDTKKHTHKLRMIKKII